VLGIVPLSRLAANDLQKIDEQQQLAVQTDENKSPSVPAHSSVSDNSWPTVLGIVPFS
jgi:hypothetical protein